MDLVSIKTYAHVLAEAYEGRLTEDDRTWLREGYKAVSAKLDLDSLEYEYKQQRRLPYMIKHYLEDTMTTLSKMLKAYMKGEDTAVKERPKPQGDGTMLTTFLLDLDRPEPTPEELAAAERRRAKASAQARGIMETLANPGYTKGRCKTRWGMYGQLKDK